MVFMGRGTNESNKKHKGKLTLELEQSDPAKCKVSLYPQRISALKKANPPLHPFLSMFLWNHKVYFQSQNTRFSNQEGQKDMLTLMKVNSPIIQHPLVSEELDSLNQTVRRGGSLKPRPHRLGSQCLCRASALQVEPPLCSVGGSSEAHASS